MNRMHILVSLKTIVIALVTVPLYASGQTSLEVQTESGVVRGVVDGTISKFLGIPDAEPPIEALRWAPPQKVANWNGVRDTVDFGSSCVAALAAVGEEGIASGEGWDLLLLPMRSETNEDCLTLNIWAQSTPNNDVLVEFSANSVIRENYRKDQYDAAESHATSIWQDSNDGADIVSELQKIQGRK